MEVVFSQQAELDLEEIADTIAIDSAPAVIRFIQAIREHCARIGLTLLIPRAQNWVLISFAVFISAT